MLLGNFYDKALDDGPMLIDNPPCLVVTTLCEDKNDIFAACDNTLTHESPTLFLNSPSYTMEEKFAYVEKYLCGLQLSLVPNICCNHDIKLYIDLNNYFERGKHANEFQNKFNDPLYVPILSKLNDSCDSMVEFISSTCNYYKRGGTKSISKSLPILPKNRFFGYWGQKHSSNSLPKSGPRQIFLGHYPNFSSELAYLAILGQIPIRPKTRARTPNRLR